MMKHVMKVVVIAIALAAAIQVVQQAATAKEKGEPKERTEAHEPGV